MKAPKNAVRGYRPSLHVKLEGDNLAQAEVTSVSERAVYVKLDPTERWDAQGLLRLSAMLRGIVSTLSATE
jgi:hypothetical protein